MGGLRSRLWGRQGFTRRPITVWMAFERRADLAAVLRIEFAAALAEEILATHAGLEIDYAVNLWWRLY